MSFAGAQAHLDDMPDWSAFEREAIDRVARHPRYEAPKLNVLPPRAAQPEEE
jgi:hypothetical protein